MSTQTTAPTEPPASKPSAAKPAGWRRAVDLVLTDRVALLSVLLVVVVTWFYLLGRQGYLVAPYDSDYLASALETLVPLCLLAGPHVFAPIDREDGAALLDILIEDGRIARLAPAAVDLAVAGLARRLLPLRARPLVQRQGRQGLQQADSRRRQGQAARLGRQGDEPRLDPEGLS